MLPHTGELVSRQFHNWICRLIVNMMTLLTVFRAETELYKALEPGIRLVILKAICDIRGEVCALLFCEIL